MYVRRHVSKYVCACAFASVCMNVMFLYTRRSDVAGVAELIRASEGARVSGAEIEIHQDRDQDSASNGERERER